MSKFFDICEAYDPTNNGNPTYDLYDFLKSQGINVSLVRGTNTLYIDTGTQTIPVNVTAPEEDAEDPAQADYNIDTEVSKYAAQPVSLMKKVGTLGFSGPQRAKRLVKDRQAAVKKGFDLYDRKTDALEDALRVASQQQQVTGPRIV